MQNDFIITLAWPEGMVKASGAWYDNILSQDGRVQGWSFCIGTCQFHYK